MKPVKRIEIIIDSLKTAEVLTLLEQNGVSGYTVIRDVAGLGERGARSGDELTGVFNNSYILTACLEELTPPIIEAIRPMLKRFGGVCLVSDAQWIIH